MGKHCCVSDCNTGVNLPSHTFPKDVTMARKWRRAICSEKIRNLSDEQLKKCVVCYKHFTENDYEATYRLRRLKPGVVPSLHLPGNDNDDVEEVVVKCEPGMETQRTYTATKEVAEIARNRQSAVETSRVARTPTLNGDTVEPGSSSPKDSTRLLDRHMEYFHYFTPKMWKLYRVACILKKKQETVVKRQLSFRQRVRQAKQYGKSPAIEKLLSSLTPAQQKFIKRQIKRTIYAPKVRMRRNYIVP